MSIFANTCLASTKANVRINLQFADCNQVYFSIQPFVISQNHPFCNLQGWFFRCKKMGVYVIKHVKKFEFRFRGFVAAISPRMVENVVENFLVRRLDVSDFGLTFAEESRNDIIHRKLN